MSYLTNTLVIFQAQTAGAETSWYFLRDLFPYILFPLAFLILGIYLAYLMHGKAFRKVRIARDQNHILNNKLNDIIEDQNVLITSLNNKYGVDKKRWNTQLARLDSSVLTLKDDLSGKDQQIRGIQNELNQKVREVEQLKRCEESEEVLKQRIKEFETQINERDGEITALREKEASTKVEFEGIIGAKDQEISKLVEERESEQGLYNRLEELEQIINERDSQLEVLQREKLEQEEDINALLTEQNEELKRLKAGEKNNGKFNEKIRDLEGRLAEKTSEIDNLKAAQLSKIQELEDILGERESSIVAIRKELDDTVNLDQGERISALEKEIEEREARITEFADLLKVQDEELTNLREILPANDEMREKISNLEFAIEEKEQEIVAYSEDSKRRIKELEYRLKNGAQTSAGNGELETQITDLNWKLTERDKEIDFLRREKDDLGSRHRSDSTLSTRVDQLERALRERESELASLRHGSGSDDLYTRITELERLGAQRERELQSLQSERESMRHELRNIELEHPTRSRTNSIGALEPRIRDLERSLAERERELRTLRSEKDRFNSPAGENGDHKIVSIERAPSEDLYARIRELEKAIDTRNHKTNAFRVGDSSEFRFVLDDGTIVYIKGDEKISYGGRMHTAEDLYYRLNRE